MRLSQVFLLVLCTVIFDFVHPEQHPSTLCQCPCQRRVKLDSNLFKCVMIYSVKTKGYLTADEHYVFSPNAERYVFVTNQNKKWTTANWNVVYKDWYNMSYALQNRFVKEEWLHAGSDKTARDSYRRYVFTKIKHIGDVPPSDGFWQFIPDPSIGEDMYRIRNALTGEFMFVDDEQHTQRHDYNRVYLWRHSGYYQSTDNRHWFKLEPC